MKKDGKNHDIGPKYGQFISNRSPDFQFFWQNLQQSRSSNEIYFRQMAMEYVVQDEQNFWP